jgi:hypothetical protein
MMQHAPGLPRRQIAITRAASVTSRAVIAAFIDQPTTPVSTNFMVVNAASLIIMTEQELGRTPVVRLLLVVEVPHTRDQRRAACFFDQSIASACVFDAWGIEFASFSTMPPRDRPRDDPSDGLL